MKNVLLLLSMFVGIAALAQNKAPLKFNETKHAFGKIPLNKPVTVEFKFTNVGTSNAIIENAESDCGCTKPEFPQAPILKGKSGVIKVTYNSATMGMFTKKVTVKVANVAEPIILTIEGEVIAAAATTSKN